MGDFLFTIGLLGFSFGIGFLIYSFFSKKKISRKKISIGIISAFIAMICGVTISPPDTEQVATHNTTVQSTTISSTKDTSSASKEKEEQKNKEIAEKKKLEEQKAKEEAERKQQEEKRKVEEQKQAEISQKTASAETILAQAEANPTRDNYNSALSAIQAIPGGNQSLSNRLASVESTIKTNEAAEAARIAEQQKQQAIAQEQSRQAAIQAEQQRQAHAAQEQATAQAQQQNNSYTVDGQWSIAANGMVFVRSDSGKYYSRVTNPNNYQYMSQIDADKAGYSRASRGNQYARP